MSLYIYNDKWSAKDAKVRSYGAGRIYEVSRKFIPRYIAVRGSCNQRVLVSHMHHADYFFIGTGPATPTGITSVRLGGVACNGFAIYIDGNESAYYAAFDNIITGVPRACAASFTFAISETHSYDYVHPNALHNININCKPHTADLPAFATKVLRPDVVTRVFAGTDLAYSKVTSAHHVHYTFHEVLNSIAHFRVAEVYLLKALTKMEGVSNSAAAGFALWFNALDDALLQAVYEFNCWDDTDMIRAMGQLKREVRNAKLMQNNVENDMLPIFEAEVLANRGIGGVSWKEEKDHRVRPDVVDMDYDSVYRASRKIMEQGKQDRGQYRSMSWSKYWKARWQFTPTGSIKSQYPEDLTDLPSDFRLRNKFVALNTTDRVNFEDWVTREPSIHAWTSTKYEWGKERAIYGCDLTNFVLTNFAMYECEERLPPNFPVGRRAEPIYVSRLLNGVLAGHEAFCFDFEDFNSQHSTHAMRAVLSAYADTYWAEMSPEQREAMSWVVQSVENQVVHDNIGGTGSYRSNGTLFSGWRLTTFMNSVLNAVYSQKIYEATESKHPMTSAHNGDDIIIGVNNALQAQGMLRNALSINVRAQPTKCVLSGVAEFLRVDRNAQGSGQYLARATATLVHSRIESGPSVSLTESLRSNETRLGEYVERGGSLDTALKLRHLYVARVADLYGNTTSEAYTILETSSVIGGISASRQASVTHEVTPRTDPDMDADSEVIHLRGKRSWRGIADMTDTIVSMVSDKSRDILNKEDVAKRIYNSTLGALSLNRRRILVTQNRYQDRARNWREHKGTYARLRRNGTFGIARLAGIRLDVMTHMGEEVDELIVKMGQSAEPMRFLAAAV